MRDLKHLGYFEDLLQTANNELIAKAKEEGKVCAAFLCENIPEPLLNLGNTFGIRLFAPNTGSMDIATYYMTSFLCETSRALLERAIEGGYNFADCLITPDGCTMMNLWTATTANSSMSIWRSRSRQMITALIL